MSDADNQKVIEMTETNLAVRTEPEQLPVAATPMGMIERALSTGASVETIQKLMELQERWEANQARKAFNEAIASAKAEMPEIVKRNMVDYVSKRTEERTNYKYEDLASIMRQIGPVLSKHGLSVRYRTSSDLNQPIAVTCILSHVLGHFEENTLTAGADASGGKNSIQAIGSTVSYLQRYTLKAALGLAAAADDDGNTSAPAPEMISQEQVKIILDLLEETNSDIEKFCQLGRIDSVPMMAAKDFDSAVRLLNQKKVRMTDGKKL